MNTKVTIYLTILLCQAAETNLEEKKSLNKVVIFCYKVIVFLPLSGPWTLQLLTLLTMQGQKLSDFIKNILICVPKMNEDVMGLEGHEDE